MKVVGTAFLLLVVAMSVAFADETTNANTKPQDTQTTQDGSNGIVVQKMKKQEEKNKKDSNSGTSTGTQNGQAGSSN